MNAVIYARYSSDAQRDESIEGQLRDCHAYAKRNDITVVGEYIDRAYSAKTDKRPDFQRMINDASNNEFDIVLVWKLDRFARNRYDSVRYKAILRFHGIEVISINENITEGAEGIILEAVLEAFAEYYSLDLSKKVTRGMTDNVIKGKCNGGTPTFGYAVDSVTHKYVVDNERAKYVVEAYNMFASGISITTIEHHFRKNNVKTARGNFFSYNRLEYLLKNKRYTGVYTFRETSNENGFPALISSELFETVQNRFKTGKRNFSKSSSNDYYILTGLLYCSHCGKQLVGESGTSHTGKVYRYYKCYSVKRGLGCRLKSLKKHEIESVVFEMVTERLKQNEVLEKLISELLKLDKDNSDKVTPLTRELTDVNRKIRNLVDFLSDGNISASVSSRLSELEAQKKFLTERINEEKLIAKSESLDRFVIIKWLDERLSRVPDSIKSLLIHIFVEKIII